MNTITDRLTSTAHGLLTIERQLDNLRQNIATGNPAMLNVTVGGNTLCCRPIDARQTEKLLAILEDEASKARQLLRAECAKAIKSIDEVTKIVTK